MPSVLRCSCVGIVNELIWQVFVNDLLVVNPKTAKLCHLRWRVGMWLSPLVPTNLLA